MGGSVGCWMGCCVSWVGLWVVGWVGSCWVGESGWKSGDSKFGSFGQALGAGGVLRSGGVKAGCSACWSTGVAGPVCLWMGGGGGVPNVCLV